MDDWSSRIANLSPVQRELLAVRLERQRPAEDPIAIIGMGCRFPGAKNPEEFWRLLRDGMETVTEVPTDRWDVDAFYDPNPAIAGKMNTRWGGFLEQVDQFDPGFFGISPREAARMDPQQRLLLEVAWEALEDGGQVPERLVGTRTGVFIGIATMDYGSMHACSPSLIDSYSGTGNALSIAANRISYIFGLQGPSMAVDTACSASLVAVHLGCQSLRNRECTLVLAGGTNVILLPSGTISYSKLGALAPDGHCKAFDARANGTVRSEGTGVVVLKPLSRAIEDGDPIYAVILGSAVNNDGRTNGLTAPSREAQETLLREAYRRSGVSPGQVQYVEAHGTGTALGDPIEARALGNVLSVGRPPGRKCVIGSVKSNIGHLEAAAGVAGLVKVALSLRERVIPPSLNFEEPSPHIPFDKLPLRVARAVESWPDEGLPAVAGVSSFGFGGTNAHVVLREAPRGRATGPAVQDAALGCTRLLPLSAHSPEALEALARAYRDFLTAEGSDDAAWLYNLCYTAAVRRNHHDYRLALVFRERGTLVEQLEAFLQNGAAAGLWSGRRAPNRRPKLAFVFPGQGAQWRAMGKLLLEREAAFRAAIEECDHAIRRFVSWSVLDELTADEARSRLEESDVCQPVLFALQVALAAQWRCWGVEPEAVVGHSMGEVAAAYVAGALSLEDAASVIVHRSRLLKTVSGQGTMAAVGLPLAEAERALAGYEAVLSVGAVNGSSSTVLSGDPKALKEVLASLEPRGIFCRPLRVDNAGHSPQMEPLRSKLVQSLSGLKPRSASIPIVSTVTGAIQDGSLFDAEYWGCNMRQPVRFSGAIDRLARDGHDVFLELSPHPVLTATVQEELRHLGREGATLPSLRREEDDSTVMSGSVASLYTLGYPIDWSGLYPRSGVCVRLPSYPWQRERYWFQLDGADTTADRAKVRRRQEGAPEHPLLGLHVSLADAPGNHVWEVELSASSPSYLADHRVGGATVLPAAAYVEMALAAATEVFGPGPCVLTDVEFSTALFLTDADRRTVQVMLSSDGVGEAAFRVYSMPDGRPRQRSWTLHAKCRIHHSGTSTIAPALDQVSLEDIRNRCGEELSGRDYYVRLRRNGLEYGPCFRAIERLWRRDGDAVGELQLPETMEGDAEGYQLHPVILDACLQVLGAAVSDPMEDRGGSLYLPIRIDEVKLHRRPHSRLWSHARLKSAVNQDGVDAIAGDVSVFDESGCVLAEIVGFRLESLERNTRRTAEHETEDWLYQLAWEPKASEARLASPSAMPAPGGQWLIFADGRGLAGALADRLRAEGQDSVLVSPGEAFERVDAAHFRIRPQRPEDTRQLLESVLRTDRPRLRGVVHLWSLEATPPEQTTAASLEDAQVLGCVSVLHLVQALTQVAWEEFPRLSLVTRGAQAVGPHATQIAVSQSPLWGLARVIALEHPELRCTRVDLDPAADPADVDALLAELQSQDREDQIALRGKQRYALRLSRCAAAPGDGTGREFSPRTRSLATSGSESFELTIPTPGRLDNLTLRAAARRSAGPEQVEIEVCTAGLNFMDVLSAQGLFPGGVVPPLGAECSGRISTLGQGVEEFQIGDEVIGVAAGSFARFAIAPAYLVARKPAHLSFAEAATIPVAFLTAHYALNHLGRLQKGDRVLIHAAAGGVGLAAVQLAQRAGCEIFATVGNAEKRAYLESLGVAHVFSTRSLEFAEEVLDRTGGAGVDIVLNSLSGEFIPKSLAVLAPYGRFVEIGKTDIYRNSHLGLRPFRRNLSFFAVDLARLCEDRPELVRSLLRELIGGFAEGSLRPLPHREFPIDESVSAFRHMARRNNIGKVVMSVAVRGSSAPGPALRDAVSTAHSEPAGGTYLITGGLGGLGLAVAQWLVDEGARHLVLIGRKAPPPGVEKALEVMRAAGAEVLATRADVTNKEQLRAVLREIDERMPPLRGIIHSAGVLDDGILIHLDEERLATVLAPKQTGAWNLHELTLEAPLDFFVLFSSVASVLGSLAQGNYAAANAFLDGLAHHRQAQGRPALSINWGPWAEVGLAARPDRAGRLALRGIGSIAREQGLGVLAGLLRLELAQVAVVPIDWAKWHQLYPGAVDLPLVSDFMRGETDVRGRTAGATGRGHVTREAIVACEPALRQRMLESYICERVARVLGLSAGKLDVHQPLNNFGLDSLTGAELKNQVEFDLGVIVSMASVLQNPTISRFASYLLDLVAGATPVASSPAAFGSAIVGEEIEELQL